MNPVPARLCTLTALFLLASAMFARAAEEEEDITAYVATIDRAASCLELEWHNDTLRKVCWGPATRITVLEEEREASAEEIGVGSYLHVRGQQRDGALRAATIEIWASAAR